MTGKEAKELVKKYRAGNCTKEEKALLYAWYQELASQNEPVPQGAAIEQALKEVSSTLPLARNHSKNIRLLRIAAALLVIGLFSALFYFLREQQPASRFSGNHYENEVPPGGNKAILELADGSVIDLNRVAIGMVGDKGDFKITKTQEGQVVYQSDMGQKKSTFPARYNAVRTPRGGQFRVILPDGSGAWLNSASSIRFPAIFSEEERKVEITGEVYFEIARKYRQADSGKVMVPFIVIAKNQQIEAVGTHFNVNAYPDEGSVRTTLLEGSVRISLAAGSQSQLLKPGQQAQSTSIQSIAVAEADMQQVIAWKNGQFSYDNDGIEKIMRQVERWYDVEVIYEGAIPENKFVGTISRDLPLSKFLDILSYTGVNFRIEGRKLVVTS